MPEPLRAAIYGRQSSGKEKSISEQIDECRADAEREGWRVTAVYRDGSSASRFGRKTRDDWQLVLAAINAAEIDVLILWESSRGDRTPETWFAFLTACRLRGLLIRIVADRRTYDVRVPRDWKNLAEDGIDNAYESERTASRVRRGQAGAAAAGRPSQGRCPFGYRRTYDPATGRLTGQGQEPDPETAPVVRGIIRDIAALVPISTITDRLNAEGVRTARDPRWGPERVATIATDPAHAEHWSADPAVAPIISEIIERVGAGDDPGDIAKELNKRGAPTVGALRWYRQRVLDLARNVAYIGRRTYNGQQYDGGWEPLIDAETFNAAQRVLSDPARVTTRPGRVRHLLSYLAVCGACGGALCAVRSRYRCMSGGCGLTIIEADADLVVTEAVIRLVSRPDFYGALRQAGSDHDREVVAARAVVAELRARLDGWRASAAAGQTSAESLAAIEARLISEIRAAQATAERAVVPPALRAVVAPGADVRTRWVAAPLPARREVIRAVAVVAIMPATVPGSRTFEPQRVRVSPR